MNAPLTDAHGRVKRKLRLSLTDRCNFRCRYCMPEQPVWMPRANRLGRDELLRLTRLFVAQGITQLRLTGGEPLLRADVVDCVAALDTLRAHGVQRISMTTNASRLAVHAAALLRAGVDDFNISLDARDPERFRQLTGAPIGPVLDGIAAAVEAGARIKLNAVLIRGENDGELLPLLDWAMRARLPLRLIEYMPLDAPGRWRRESVFDEAAMLDVLRTRHHVEPQARGSDPATPYLVDGDYELGIISTVSRPFCASCDRLRLTADGELYSCLFSTHGMPLGARLRAGADDAELERLLRDAVWRKPPGYVARPGPVERPVTMHGMGG